MIRSLIVAVSVGVILPVLGSYVINRNLGFMGDAMAHASLPGLAFGLLIGVSIFIAAIPAAIIIALVLGYLINRSKIGEDTAIGIIFSSLFALGFIMLSIYDHILLSVEDLLLGQILAVSRFDVWATLILSAIIIITTLVLYKQFLFISFDPKGAKISGLNVRLFDNIFLVVLSLSIISSIQSVGIILVLSMLITPAAAAKLTTRTFSSAMVTGSAFGVIASLSGLYLSYYLDFPSGPSMALAATSIFIIVWIVKRSFNYAN
jgi:manganese/iron transport system permease protein|tara:strand:- start:164 stop:949 length:786 start_codon:yes stop_codon:yes gene_type:complete